MSDKLFSDIRERLEKATPGPWTVDEKAGDWFGVESDADPTDWICYGDDSEHPRPIKANALFIAHSPTDIARLLKAVDLAEAELKHAIKFFREYLKWQDADEAEPERACLDSFEEALAQLAALSSDHKESGE